MKATVLVENSFIFSPGNLFTMLMCKDMSQVDVTLFPSFLFHLSRFSFYINTKLDMMVIRFLVVLIFVLFLIPLCLKKCLVINSIYNCYYLIHLYTAISILSLQQFWFCHSSPTLPSCIILPANTNLEELA